MAVALTKHVFIIQYKANNFDEKSAVFPGAPGVLMSVEHIHGDVITSKQELPVKGCVDFSITNKGTAKAYLFDGAVEILPGQTWFPQKSTSLPIINQPVLTFEGDAQLTRSVADVITPAPTS